VNADGGVDEALADVEQVEQPAFLKWLFYIQPSAFDGLAVLQLEAFRFYVQSFNVTLHADCKKLCSWVLADSAGTTKRRAVSDCVFYLPLLQVRREHIDALDVRATLKHVANVIANGCAVNVGNVKDKEYSLSFELAFPIAGRQLN
jgi:hypothetical protein